MFLRLLAVGVAAALPFADIPEAASADLFGPYDSGYSASPYEDPRYADIYRHPKPPKSYQYGEQDEEPYEDPHYADPEPPYPGPKRYAAPGVEGPYGWSERRRWRGDYLEPMPRARGFEDYRPRRAHLPPGCLPRAEVRRELIRDGWSDFHDLASGGQFAVVNARRPNGALYRLKVDRCAGEIVNAERIEEPADSYAWRRQRGYPAY